MRQPCWEVCGGGPGRKEAALERVAPIYEVAQEKKMPHTKKKSVGAQFKFVEVVYWKLLEILFFFPSKMILGVAKLQFFRKNAQVF